MARRGHARQAWAAVTGARTVPLGLAAVALITFALAASLVYNSLVMRRRPDAGPQGAIGRAFRAAEPSQPVTGLGGPLPVGMPEATALKQIAADGFACTFEARAATCFRSVGAGHATDIWTIWLTFDTSDKITASQGERRSAKL